MGIVQKLLHPRSSKGGEFFMTLQEILGFSPGEIKYYQQAFTHPATHKKDETGREINYERLEFLGDAILDTVVAAYLFKELPDADEGNLTQMRAKLVSRSYLNQLGRDLKLIELVEKPASAFQYGKNIHGNLFEALIGAVFEDKGYKYCVRFIQNEVIEAHVDIHQLQKKIISYKSYLINWCQKKKKDFEFETFEDTGKESCKHFAVKLHIANQVIAKARSTSKKKAEEKAARRAYYSLQHKIES